MPTRPAGPGVKLFPMSARNWSLLDRCLNELDTALRVVALPSRARRPNPAGPEVASGPEDTGDRALAAGLMRVNHAGEVAAQALYRGQALVARDDRLRQELLRAADEEHDHLAWCEERVQALGSHTSRLNPFWYGGSFVLGMAAGLAGDRVSLGFLAETERQVTAHLDGHLQRLPAGDTASRAIVARMRDEEVTHGTAALDRGGVPLPTPVRRAMTLASRVMTTVARWV
jgi:ubiquinone biosynthesis monooxygenase Coq7